MTEIQELTEALVKFRNERDWKQFHNSKDLSLAISIEAAELLQVFLWKNADSANKEKIKEELADIFAFCLLLAESERLDIKQIVLEKISKNAEKYPIDKAKGTSKKYNEL
jgi:NTP pyrophosphatase (non-canonical NTP hydrolase)